MKLSAKPISESQPLLREQIEKDAPVRGWRSRPS